MKLTNEKINSINEKLKVKRIKDLRLAQTFERTNIYANLWHGDVTFGANITELSDLINDLTELRKIIEEETEITF